MHTAKVCAKRISMQRSLTVHMHISFTCVPLCQIFVLRMRLRALCVFHSKKRTTLEPENGSFFVVSVCAVEDLLDQQIQTHKHTENTLHTRR